MRTVVSFGGGVNSTAMLVGMVARGYASPDAVLFADTGGERKETYEHIKRLSDWLSSRGYPKITTVHYKTKYGRRITLEQEILKQKTLPSIAFGFKTCSQKHKIHPQMKWIKYHWGRESINWFIGFDASESRRVKENPNKGHINTYPLIEWGLDRNGCIEEIRRSGVDIPVKSSCIFCPNMKKSEILALTDEEKGRVTLIENNACGLKTVKGLGRTYRWTDLLNGDSKEADKEAAHEQSFKELTGEELNPITCECID